ncbi:MAG: ABC transporter permease [Alicyclobacillus sp.]|nr:ABC transporter permease [Alicyclobacillus sp.]
MSMIRGVFTAIRSLWDYKGRSFLALLGMAISSLLLAFLMSALYNFKVGIEGQLGSIGFREVVALPGRMLNSDKMNRFDLSSLMSVTTMNSTLTAKDAADVKKEVPSVTAAVPQTEIVSHVSYGKKSVEALYTGTTQAFPDIFRLTMAEGRWLNNQDVKKEAQVVVLGATTKQQLFGNSNAIGKQVTIKGLKFTVVGVLAPKELVGFNFDERVYTEYQMLLDTTTVTHASMIFFSVDRRADLNQAAGQIDGVISHNHGTKDFMIVKADEALHVINVILNLVTALTIGVSGVSFLVGGIGIMNVMLLIVKERTREIGLRKAVGAKSYQVLMQFLVESALISVLGSLIGLGVSYGMLRLAGHLYPALPTSMPMYAGEASLVFSVVIGLLFGLIPAIKAVRIQPVDALRYE